MNISNKTFIVTGASSGIGEDLAKKLAHGGANVVCAARRANELHRVVTGILSSGGSGLEVPTDITDPIQCQELVSKTFEKFGSLHGLVLNAGVSMWSPFEKIESVDYFRKIMETNYMGAVYCCHAAMDQLKKNKGLIINCSTGQALMGFPNHTGYAASKHAVHGFLESLDIELDGQINIMHVIMGWIRGTGLRENAFGPNGKKLGQSKRKHNHESVSIDHCTDIIMAGIKSEKNMVYVPRKLRFIPFLNIFFKSLLRKKITKAVKDQS